MTRIFPVAALAKSYRESGMMALIVYFVIYFYATALVSVLLISFAEMVAMTIGSGYVIWIMYPLNSLFAIIGMLLASRFINSVAC